MNKSKVFVVTPFNDDFLALYQELKKTFEENFEFTNAGDLENQQNILQDIVEGIHQADVIIADLTGLNANVFYELGLAHAMNKKVIIITQDIGELPFDIKSYRANEYSLQFNKLPLLVEKLEKLLHGAIDDSIKYGNPVSDYIPNFYQCKSKETKNEKTIDLNHDENDNDAIIDENDGGGFLDCIADIGDNLAKMTDEVNAINTEMDQMSASVNSSHSELERVKSHSGNLDANFARNICRKLAEPIDGFSGKLNGHTHEISKYWALVENDYLSLLDNPHTKKEGNIVKLQESMLSLQELQEAINGSNVQIIGLIDVLRGNLGMERRLNKAIVALITGLEEYLSTTETMYSSIDRILAKGDLVIDNLMK